MKTYTFLLAILLSSAAVSYGQQDLNIHPDLIPLLDQQMAPFYHGVASGDPTQDAVIIWTKVTLPKAVKDATVHWELAKDKSFKSIIKKGELSTDGSKDFTVKEDVTGLEQNTKYYYRFRYHNTYSEIGETKTLPVNSDKFSIGFASCSNYEWGYFNNYRFMAEDTTIDLVVHLGDYIYEYAPGKYGDTTIGRINVPAKEIVSLDDYRTRYSQYRLDKDLQKAHRLKPFITTWDDHEIANNGYMDGAQNHQPDKEGDWKTRRSVGTQSYYEWMPIRDNAQHELYRSFHIGQLFSLLMLDTRITGRTEQVENENDPHYLDSNRTILGRKQYGWLMNELKDTSTTWKIIGNQVPFGPIYQVNWGSNGDKYMDGWDGYPAEKNKLIHDIQANAIRNIIFVTGDYHTSIAFENDLTGTKETDDNVSVEFVVTSITSANDDEYAGEEDVKKSHDRYLELNPHAKYVNNTDNGYLVLTLTPGAAEAVYYYATTVKQPDAKLRKEKTFRVNSGKPVLMEH